MGVSSSKGRVLVTGATGFVGSQVLAILAADTWDLHGVRRSADGSPAPLSGRITWHICDLREPGEAASLLGRVRPTHLLHLAWNAEHRAYWTAADNEAWADGTLALARSFAEQRGRRFVAAGTCAEYDWTDLSAPCREEETPCRPQTPYGRGKLRAATGVMEIAREMGLSAAWGRLFFLYGPGEDPNRLIPAVTRALRAGERAKVTEGRQVRDFLHVSEAAAAFVALLSDSVTGAVNIGSGVPVTIRSVVESLARMLGRPDLVDFGAMPMQPGEPPMIVADIGRLASTGWKPRITLEDGLAALIQRI